MIDREQLPKLYPTHRHAPQFWEQLGRTIATFGFLEEVLGKAIFAFTATRRYSSWAEAEESFRQWLVTLEKALIDTLPQLADSYRASVQQHGELEVVNLDALVAGIKQASEIRNVLCHGSWRVPDGNGKSLPLFVNRRKEIFQTPIDVSFLEQTQSFVMGLACDVMDSVTLAGWQFSGSPGLGEEIWNKH